MSEKVISRVITWARLALMVLTLAVLAAPATAKELRIASGLPPMHPAHNPLYTDFRDLLAEKTSGGLSGRLLGTEVATLANMRTAIHSGLVEIGIYLPAYFPADLPDYNLLGDLSMLAGSPHATSGALTEYFVTCEDCQAELKRLRMVYTTSHSNPYSLLTRKPVTSPEDLRGMRIRVATPQHARWVEAMGGTPVNMPTGETFEAMSQGIIEGTVTSITDLISFNLAEVISYITLLDLGTFHSMVPHAVSNRVWAALSEDQREAVYSASIIANSRTTQRLLDMVVEGKEAGRQHGVEILEPAAELVAVTEAFLESDIQVAAERAISRHGVQNAEEKIARFRELVTKWEGLVDGLEGQPDAVAEVLERELMQIVDLKTYGL